MKNLDERRAADYARELRSVMPARMFAPVPARVAWLFLHAGVIVASAWLIVRGWGSWPLALALSMVIGHSFACVTFLGHETFHGSVVRGRLAQYVIGAAAFLPFVLSPRLWKAWHNRIHHGHTTVEGKDPDTWPTLATYRRDRLARVMDKLSFGERRWWGPLMLTVAFTVQSQQVLWRTSRRFMPRGQRRIAMLESVAGMAFWAAIGVALGPGSFFFVFLLPMLVANVIVISYIATNHGLSPLTEVNDPMLNSLTVTTPRLLERMHLGFGYHVEHHILPSVSSRHAPAVRRLLLERWPERYQTMPLRRALHELFVTPRVYKDATTLVSPRTGVEQSTLLPRRGAAALPR
jgi:fatty acid desaturase